MSCADCRYNMNMGKVEFETHMLVVRQHVQHMYTCVPQTIVTSNKIRKMKKLRAEVVQRMFFFSKLHVLVSASVQTMYSKCDVVDDISRNNSDFFRSAFIAFPFTKDPRAMLMTQLKSKPIAVMPHQ